MAQHPGERARIQRHFAACLRAGREPETSGADNLATLALVYAAYDSAADGGRTIAMGRDEGRGIERCRASQVVLLYHDMIICGGSER